MAGLIGCLLLRLYLAAVYEINWDEFLNLSMVYEFERGTLTEPLQTLFVRAFGWLGAVSVNEVEQLIAARMAMVVMVAATTALIIWTALRFMPLHAALFAGLCFAAFSFGLRQGATFRTDTMATPLIMAAIAIVVRRPGSLWWAALAGAAMGLAGMVTIKAIFHAPTVAVICLLGLTIATGRARAFTYGCVVAGSALAVFAAAYLLHRAGLEAASSAMDFLDRTTGKTLADTPSVLDRYWQAAVRRNLVFACALAIGLALIFARLIRGHHRRDNAVLLALALPMASFGYYSETYPYFFPFVLAPVSVIAGLALTAFPAMAGRWLALAGLAIIGVQTVLSATSLAKRDNGWQRQVLDVVHRMYPAPVAYTDHASMVSSFRKTGLFLSAWGLSDYYARAEPVLRDAINRDRPRFVLINQPMLSFERLDPTRAGRENNALLAADIRALRENYIPHWGPIAVAGKTIELSPDALRHDFQIVIPGPYTIEAPTQIVLDGKPVEPDSVVHLKPGPHSLSAGAAITVTLRSGERLYRPTQASGGALFTGF